MYRYSQAYLGAWAYVPRSEVNERSLMGELTIESRYENGGPIALFDDSHGRFFGVPLYHFRGQYAEEIIDRRAVGSVAKFKFRSGYRTGQEELVDKFGQLVQGGGTGFILEAPPGFGKTVCLLSMAARLGVTSLIVVPRSNLIKQWIDRAREHTSLSRSDIGWIEGGKAVWKGKKVVVGLVHSIALDRYGPEFRKYFGCTIFDEVDRSVPPATFAPVVSLIPSKYRIAASATLKRSDGMHVVFEKHIGQYLLKGIDANRMKPKILMVGFGNDSGQVPRFLAKLSRRGMILSRLAENPERNTLITEYVIKILRSGRRCLILSDRTQQLDWLRKSILNMGRSEGMTSRDVGFYTRQLTDVNGNKRTVPESERKQTASACKLILATYGMFSLGTDIPDLAALVYATPQSNVEQAQGRIERLLMGKLEPVIVDIVDTAYQDTLNWANARSAFYRRKGLTVVQR